MENTENKRMLAVHDVVCYALVRVVFIDFGDKMGTCPRAKCKRPKAASVNPTLDSLTQHGFANSNQTWERRLFPPDRGSASIFHYSEIASDTDSIPALCAREVRCIDSLLVEISRDIEV